MSHTPKTAIIGLGYIGQAIAADLAKSGTPFIAADRKLEKAKELAAGWGASATPSDIRSALAEADIAILAIPFEAISEFLTSYAAELEGKIIIDPSNPIALDGNGGFKKIIEPNQSAGVLNAKHLPKGAKLVKAFGTLGAASLAAAAHQNSQKAVLFYATDNSSIQSQIEQLIAAAGFEALKVGGLDQSIRIEVFGDLHEYGALGKTVTLEEANSHL